jgi:hypothetical protein
MSLKRGEGPWPPWAPEEDARRLAEFERARMGAPWDEVAVSSADRSDIERLQAFPGEPEGGATCSHRS